MKDAMKDARDSAQVFKEAVEDHLRGRPHERHPVQFERHTVGGVMEGTVRVPKECSLCRALVKDEEGHRVWHDDHVVVHNQILSQAQRRVDPPTYR